MQFGFTEEQKLIAAMAEDFARAEGGSQRVRQAMATELGYIPEVWQSMANGLGLAGLLVPEAAGGQALSMVETALVFEQFGKQLLPSPLLSTAVLSVVVLKELGLMDHLRSVAGGECTLATARLKEGEARFVLDAAVADMLVVIDADRSRAYVVEGAGDCPGIEVTPVNMLDQTRRMAHVAVTDFAAIADAQVAAGEGVEFAVERGFDMARIALAAEAVGATDTCLERTVSHVKERVQFGRTLGSFQAVKHQLADMLVAREAAVSAVYLAACAVSENAEEARRMAALAKVQASDAFSFCAGRMIQLHGGIGFTWEHDAHLYFKRARSTSTLFGVNADLEETIASSIGLVASA